MEVKTGDIKAIVNMTKCADGEYYEIKNSAVSDLLEPGSVFKTASLMVALDDGVVDTTYTVDTGSGIWDMYGAKMRDHNWHRGGYQVLTLPQTLEYRLEHRSKPDNRQILREEPRKVCPRT